MAHARTCVPIISASVSWLTLRESGWNVPFTKVCEQQEGTRQPLLTRIEQLVDQILLDAGGPGQKMGDEISETPDLTEHAHHGLLSTRMITHPSSP